jgi:hypothetical protein
MDVVKQRRTTLTPTASPRTGLDYLVSLGGRLEAPPWPEPIAVALRYVPDDLVLAPSARVADNEHQVDFEQTKPGWDNRMLLARMRID